MARPIRIPQRDPGGGTPAVLPSVSLAGAGPLANVRIGEELVAGLGGVADRMTQAREEDKRKADALTRARERAQSEEILKAGLSAMGADLDQYEQRTDFTEEGWQERFRAGTERAFADASAGITDEELLASLEGGRAGLLAGDMSGALAGVRDRRAGLAIDRSTADAVRFAGEEASIDLLPALADSVAADYDRILRDFPGKAPQVEEARKRSYEAIERRYRRLGGAMGELRFFADALDGDLDGLSGPLLEEAKARAPMEILKIAAELQETYLESPPTPTLTDNGGLFPVFEFGPNRTDLEALREDLSNLPEAERQIVERAIDSSIGMEARRAELHKNVIEPLFEGVPMDLTGASRDPLLRDEIDLYFNGPVKEWLNRTDVAWQDKTRLLVRTIRSLGYLSPAMGAWVEDTVNSASSDPGTLIAIAQAKNAIDPDPVRVRRALTSDKELARELSGQAPLALDPLSGGTEDFLLDLGRQPTVDPGYSVDVARGNRLKVGGGGTGTGKAGAGFMERAFGLDTDATEAARQASEDMQGALREAYGKLGVEVDSFSVRSIQRLEDRIRAELPKWEKEFPPDEAMSIAKDRAMKASLVENPPVRVLGRVYMDGDLRATLQNGKYPERMIDETVIQALRERGYDVEKGDLLKRVRLVKFDDTLAPNQFQVWISDEDGTGGTLLDGALTIDGSEYDALRDDMKSQAVLRSIEQASTEDPEVFQKRADELDDVWFMRPEEYRRWATGFGAKDLVRELPGSLNRLGKIGPRGLGIAAKALQQPKIPSNGRPLFERSPALLSAYRLAYEGKMADLLGRQAMQAPPFTEDELDRLADRDGKRAARARLEEELKGLTPAERMKYFRLGKLPSEVQADPSDPLSPTRGAVP